MKLKTKLISLFLFISLIPLSIASFLFIKSSKQAVSNLLKEQQRSGLISILSQTEDQLKRFRLEIVPLASLNLFSGVPFSDRKGESVTSNAESLLGNYYLANSQFLSVLQVTDYSSRRRYVIDKVTVTGSGISPYSRLEPADSAEFFYTGTDTVLVSGEQRGSEGYITVIKINLRGEDGTVRGDITLNIKFSTIVSEVIRRNLIRNTQYFVISDGRGNTVFSIAQENGAATRFFNPAFDVPENGKPGVFTELADSRGTWYHYFTEDKTLGLQYHSYVFVDPYLTKIRNGSYVYIGIISFLVAIVIFIINIISQKMSNRINRIKVVAGKIASGDLEARIGTITEDEMGQLSLSVNAMAEDLKGFLENQAKMLKEIAEKEKLAELNRMQSRFLSMTSHEIITPLTTVKWTIDNLLQGVYGDISQKQREYLTQMNRSADHLVRTVKNLLDLSRIESGMLDLNLERCSVKSIIDEAVYFTEAPAREKDIKIEKLLDIDSGKSLFCDRDRVLYIMRNLLDNAVKFSPPDAVVTVSAKYTQDMFEIGITDAGCGIPEEDIGKVFTAFYKVQQKKKSSKGLGLGLSIVKNLVALHQGTIAVKSTIGKGTVFTVTLPENGISDENKDSDN